MLIGNAQQAHNSISRDKAFYTLNMHIGILLARTVPYIKRELKHSEAIAYKILAELCSLLALMLRFGRKVKEYKHPHNPIFTDATVHRITQMLKDG